MSIFHLAKGQENLNSRSKMAHLPLRGTISMPFWRSLNPLTPMIHWLYLRIEHSYLEPLQSP